MDAIYLCPVCQGPVPADAASQDAPVLVDCPSCGTSLVRAPDEQQGMGWHQLDSSSD